VVVYPQHTRIARCAVFTPRGPDRLTGLAERELAHFGDVYLVVLLDLLRLFFSASEPVSHRNWLQFEQLDFVVDTEGRG
jgi:hypothetical protein